MTRILALPLLILCVLACSGPSPAHVAAAAPLVPMAPAAANRDEPVQLWSDASIFGLVGGLIASARSRVLVEMYELGRPDVVRALGAATKLGLDVRVITDPSVAASRRSSVTLDRLAVS
jgi:hypothetical protein